MTAAERRAHMAQSHATALHPFHEPSTIRSTQYPAGAARPAKEEPTGPEARRELLRACGTGRPAAPQQPGPSSSSVTTMSVRSSRALVMPGGGQVLGCAGPHPVDLDERPRRGVEEPPWFRMDSVDEAGGERGRCPGRLWSSPCRPGRCAWCRPPVRHLSRTSVQLTPPCREVSACKITAESGRHSCRVVGQESSGKFAPLALGQ